MRKDKTDKYKCFLCFGSSYLILISFLSITNQNKTVICLSNYQNIFPTIRPLKKYSRVILNTNCKYRKNNELR